jgi:hypothetical protein
MVPKGRGDRARSKIPAIPLLLLLRLRQRHRPRTNRARSKRKGAPARPHRSPKRAAEGTRDGDGAQKRDIDGASTKPLLIGSFWGSIRGTDRAPSVPHAISDGAPDGPQGLLGGEAKKALEAAMTGENQSAKVQAPES